MHCRNVEPGGCQELLYDVKGSYLGGHQADVISCLLSSLKFPLIDTENKQNNPPELIYYLQFNLFLLYHLNYLQNACVT